MSALAIICHECAKRCDESRVYPCGSTTTLLGWQPFYDESGAYHAHNPNTVTTGYRCSNGHMWATEEKPPCPNPKCDTGGNQ